MSESGNSRPQRRYGNHEQAAALAVLAECGGNAAEASRATGIPEQTLRDWGHGSIRPADPNLVAEMRAKRAEKWDALQDAGVAKSLEKLEDSNAYHCALIAAIATDKAALLRGEATSISASVEVSVTLTPADLDAARQLLAQLPSAPSPPALLLTPAPPANPGESG